MLVLQSERNNISNENIRKVVITNPRGKKNFIETDRKGGKIVVRWKVK